MNFTSRLLSLSSTAAFVLLDELTDKSKDCKHSHDILLQKAAETTQKELKIFALKFGVPGMAATVSICGKRRFFFSHGYADVENLTPFSVYTVSRIASISKCFTAVIACKLLESGAFSLNDTVSKFIKNFDGPASLCTIQQLLSHTCGVRSYKKKNPQSNSSASKEMYVKKNFKTLADAVEMFKNDALLHSPGTKYVYSTHGYTLLSLVLSKIDNDLEKTFMQFFHLIGLKATYIEKNDVIIPGRSRQYEYDKKHALINVPYVNNTYKFAGGGLLSSSYDLNLFGEYLVKCYLGRTDKSFCSYISPEMVKLMWKPIIATDKKSIDYGLGWMVVKNDNSLPFHVFHTGGAVGGTSVILILPCESCDCTDECCGIVINVLCNMQSASGLYQLAKTIANVFYPIFKTLCETGKCHALTTEN